MRKFISISVMSLLLLLTLSFSESGEALAQKKSKGKESKEYKDKKGGPPEWAPAHGYRRKKGEDQYEKSRKWEDSDEKRKFEKREIALKRREEALKEREEALKRKESSSDEQVEGKKRPSDILRKRRSQQKGDTSGGETKSKEGAARRKAREMREKMESSTKSSGSENKDWSGGTGW